MLERCAILNEMKKVSVAAITAERHSNTFPLVAIDVRDWLPDDEDIDLERAKVELVEPPTLSPPCKELRDAYEAGNGRGRAQRSPDA